MDPITQSVLVSRPVGEVFEYLADVANHPEFLDHFTSEWHLTREDTYGAGAGIRYKVHMRGNRFPWVDQTVLEVDAPRRLVLAGRGGKYNRIRTVTVYELEPQGAGDCRVSVTFETEGKLPSDKLFDRRGFYKRRFGKGLRRLAGILEEDRGRGKRASIAGGARKPATGTPLR
ncbi:MAG: hypothetical protein JWM31_1812 [Solirubrobacterales bacterium]|nr:hypothetical protein [Solirubrobacterales bacterium]